MIKTKIFSHLFILLFLLVSSCENIINISEEKKGTGTLPAFLETIVGNPLVASFEYLDTDNNQKIEFSEAYLQTIKAQNSIGNKFSSKDLELIDLNQDKSISQEELQKLTKDMSEIFNLQDGVHNCTNQEVIDEFSKLTNNFFYYDTDWVGKLVEYKKDYQCLSTNFNMLLFKAIEAIDTNKDTIFNESELKSLYGNRLSYEDFVSYNKNKFNIDYEIRFETPIATYPEMAKNNMWLWDYSGELKRTLELESLEQFRHLMYRSGNFTFTKLILKTVEQNPLDITEENNIYGSHYMIASMSRYEAYIRDLILGPERNFEYHYDLIAHEYSIEKNPQLVKFDLNQDGVYNFIDKLVIDYVTQVSYINKKENCHYSIWGRPFLEVSQICSLNKSAELSFSINEKELILKDNTNEIKKNSLKLSFQHALTGSMLNFYSELSLRSSYLASLSESKRLEILNSELTYEDFKLQALSNMSASQKKYHNFKMDTSLKMISNIEVSWIKYFPEDIDEFRDYQNQVILKMLELDFLQNALSQNGLTKEKFAPLIQSHFSPGFE